MHTHGHTHIDTDKHTHPHSSQESADHVDEKYGMTLTEYMKNKIGIQHIYSAHIVMVAAKRAHETHHL